MIFAKLLALLLIAILPWYTLSMTMSVCGSKKVCDYGKEFATNVKDVTLQINNFATALGYTLAKDDVMAIVTHSMSIAGFLGVGFGVTSFVLSKQQTDEVKAAVEKLSKKMDLLSLKIDSSINRVIAHQDHKQFQTHVSLPARSLVKKYFDVWNTGLQEDVIILKKECKKARPLNILDKMEKLLVDNADNILLSHQYTDEAFETYANLHYNTFAELGQLYNTCEDLLNERDANVDLEVIMQHRMQKYEKRYDSVYDILTHINKTREEKVWNNILPTELDRLYNEYGKLKFDERQKKEFADQVAHKLNSDYSQFEHYFSFGVIKNRTSKCFGRKRYHFACEKDVCLKKVAGDYVVWILRSKRCNHGNEVHSSPNACLQFQAELYNRFDTIHKLKSARVVLEIFMRNCHIENAIALFAYKRRLRGDSAGMAPFYRERNREKLFNFTTEMPHVPFHSRRNNFKKAVFWTECPKNDQPFDFYNAYCKAGTQWPNCTLTQAAFMLHELHDAPPRGTEFLHKGLELSTEQPDICESTEESEVNE